MKYILIFSFLMVFENLQSQNILPFYYTSKGVYKYVDSASMKPAFNFEWPLWHDHFFKGNIAIALMKNSTNENSYGHGIINKKGTTIISGLKKWLFTEDLNDSRFLRISFQFKEGVLDTNGRVILPPIYDKIVRVNGNHIIASKNNKRGMFDSNGMQEVDFIFDRIDDIISDQVLLVGQKGKYGVYNFKQGKYIIPSLYEELFYEKEFKLYYATLNSKMGCLDEKGNIKIPFEFDKIGAIGGESPTWYLKNKKVGYINKNGLLITDPVFDYEVYFFHMPGFIQNMCVVIKNGKYGIINQDGTYLIQPSYEYLKITDNGNIYFKKNTLFGVMSKTGQIIIPPSFSSLQEFSGFYIFKNEISEYYGIIKAGSTAPIINPEYIEIKTNSDMKVFFMRNETETRIFKISNGELSKNYYNELRELGLNYILAYKNSKWGVIDYNENVVLDFKYNSIVGMLKNYFICENGDGKFFYVDKNGREFIE